MGRRATRYCVPNLAGGAFRMNLHSRLSWVCSPRSWQTAGEFPLGPTSLGVGRGGGGRRHSPALFCCETGSDTNLIHSSLPPSHSPGIRFSLSKLGGKRPRRPRSFFLESKCSAAGHQHQSLVFVAEFGPSYFLISRRR